MKTAIKFVLAFLVLSALSYSLRGCQLALEPGGPPIGYPGAPKSDYPGTPKK